MKQQWHVASSSSNKWEPVDIDWEPFLSSPFSPSISSVFFLFLYFFSSFFVWMRFKKISMVCSALRSLVVIGSRGHVVGWRENGGVLCTCTTDHRQKKVTRGRKKFLRLLLISKEFMRTPISGREWRQNLTKFWNLIYYIFLFSPFWNHNRISFLQVI